MPYPTRFPRNAWYVAARSEEVSRDLLGRWLLGDPVCLYRGEDGTPVALVDRCIHRQMPLSRGRLRGDAIECGYHGLTFDSTGACIRIPGSDTIPARVRVQGFPVVEGHGLIWIWMGEPTKADPDLIPDHHWLDAPGWVMASGTLHLNARAQLLNENLLDLSHLTFLHPDSIGSPEIAEIPIDVSHDGGVVRVKRTMPGVQCPPFFSRLTGHTGPIDRLQLAEFLAPGFHRTHTYLSPAGSTSGEDDAAWWRMMTMHCVTPETRTTTHYFWAVTRNYAVEDAEATPFITSSITSVFQQDIEAAEAIERIIAFWEPDYPIELNIKVDAGPIQARRIIERMIHDEGGEPYAQPAAVGDGPRW